MNVVSLNSIARKDGNTETLLNTVLMNLKKRHRYRTCSPCR
jgi:hypothetical protein